MSPYRVFRRDPRRSGRTNSGRFARTIGHLTALSVLAGLGLAACRPADADSAGSDGSAADVQVDAAIADLFETTARSTDSTYRVGYRALVQLGPDIRDYLQATADDTDWPDKWLARALLAELDEPERAELIRRVLRVLARCEVSILDSGEIKIIYDEKHLDNRVESASKTLILGPETIPLFVQALPQVDRYRQNPLTAALLDALAHFNDPETATPMLWRCEHLAIDALAAMGEPVAGTLEDVIALQPGWRDNPHTNTRVAAATALGRIGADSSAPVLLAAMEELATTDILEKDEAGLALAEAYCLAAADLQADGAAGVMCDLLFLAADGWGGLRDYRTTPAFAMIRAAVLSLGQAGRDELNARVDGETLASHRAIAYDMLIAMDNPVDPSAETTEQDEAHVAYHHWRRQLSPGGLADNWTAPSIRTRVAAGVGLKYLPLVTLVDRPFGLDVLEQILLAHGETEEHACRDYHKPIIEALGDMDDARVLGLLRKHLARRPVTCVGSVIDAIVRLADADGTAILDDIIAVLQDPDTPEHRYNAGFLEGAQTARKALTASLDELVEMATSEPSESRRQATYVLARRGHVEAAEILLGNILTRADGGGWVWQAELVGLGEVALPTVQGRFDSSDDPDEKILCEALILRLTDPQLAADFDKMMRPPITQAFGQALQSRAMPHRWDYENVGRHIAETMDPNALPLLEALAVMSPESRVVGCALAANGAESSLALMTRHLNQTTAWTLLGFGPAGRDVLLQAAKPTQPGQLAAVHWAVTSALAYTDRVTADAEPDPVVLELIIEAFALVETDAQVAQHGSMYLRLAERYDDARLADGIFNIARSRPSKDALLMLQKYEHPGLEEICDAYVQQHGFLADDVIRMLVAFKGDQIGNYLLEQVAASRRGIDRDRILGTLVRVHDRSEPDVRENVRQSLLTYMNSSDEDLRLIGLGGLLRIESPLSEEVTEALIAWLKTHDGRISAAAISYLRKSGHPQAGPLLLARYGQHPRSNRAILDALVALDYQPALPVIVEHMEQHIRQWRRCVTPAQSKRKSKLIANISLEMLAIRRLGPDGRDVLMDILRDGPDLLIRAEAAVVTTAQRGVVLDPEHWMLTKDMLNRLVANGLADPSLTGDEQQRAHEFWFMTRALQNAVQAYPVETCYPILLDAALRADEPEFREELSARVIRLARQDPDLPAVPPDFP